MAKLTALSVKNAKAGRHADGDGLYLLVKPTGGKSWLLRVQVNGKRRDVGLGATDTLSRVASSPIVIPILQRKVLTLSEAREKAGMLRTAAKSGLDPVAERDRERLVTPTFRAAAEAAHEALQSGWKGKGAQAFFNSLENHVFASLGGKRQRRHRCRYHRRAQPIWTTKPDMACKVRQRIGKVLNFAHSKGWRPTEAPGRSVSVGLVRQPEGGNYKAMPYADVPEFVADVVRRHGTNGRQALLFLIYTAARPGEARGARWGQIDFGKRDWNRPSTLMKGVDAPPHTVTLNSVALQLLEQLRGEREHGPNDLISPGQRGGTLSDMTLNKVIRAAGLPYDAHAFRSSFRDWAAERMPDIPDPVAEAALAHVVANQVERAYKRTKYVEMRRELLEAWGAFVSSGATQLL